MEGNYDKGGDAEEDLQWKVSRVLAAGDEAIQWPSEGI
jgi:hypothetical protein